MIKVNIFDDTCAHHVKDYGYFTSTDGRKPTKIEFVHKQMEFDGITLFADSYIFNPIIDQVKSKIKVAWSLESPAVQNYLHNNIHLFADKFDYVLCYREDLIQQNPQKFIPNSPGGTYIKDEEINLYNNLKTKKCSLILSGKKSYPGHTIRHQILQASGQKSGIDFFGWGSPTGHIVNKNDALKEYMFHIAIENIKAPHYFTEKLIDCLVTGCVPIYYGAPNIDKYFNIDGFVLFDNFESFLNLKLNKDIFCNKIKAIEENFKLAQQYKSSDDHLATKLEKLINS